MFRLNFCLEWQKCQNSKLICEQKEYKSDFDENIMNSTDDTEHKKKIN